MKHSKYQLSNLFLEFFLSYFQSKIYFNITYYMFLYINQIVCYGGF